MDAITCLAIDDEAPALRVIEQYVNDTPGLQLAAKFRNPVEAAEWLKTNSCKILFLDIQMPQQTGMDFIKSLSQQPVTIFTTAYSEFAAQAFDLDAVDYLRKPFAYERFLKAVDKAKDYLKAYEQTEPAGTILTADNFISVKANGRLVKIQFSEIIYIEAFQEYIKIFTTGERYIIYERMKNIEALLPPDQFMRVHRSYIVALPQVKSIAGNLLEIAGQNIPVSREMKEELIKRAF